MKNSNKTKAVFIGYDDRQNIAFDVCVESIKKHTSTNLDIFKVEHKTLRNIGLFNRGWVVEGTTGLFKDELDGLKFSTQFSHTRFLVPEYAKWLGYEDSSVMFVDPDFVFLDDIDKLFDEFHLTQSSVACVKHDYNPENTVKMDGQVQTSYPKKLWSSLMMFDLSKPTKLDSEYVNTASTKDLHRFEWIYEGSIGALDERWNFIPDHSENRIGNKPIGAIHFTEGLPEMEGYETCKYSHHYHRIRNEVHPRRN